MATIYLVDMADYPGMNEVWDKWVAKDATPARATVQVRDRGQVHVVWTGAGVDSGEMHPSGRG